MKTRYAPWSLFLLLFITVQPLSADSDVQVFFADDDTPQQALVQAINSSQKSIHLCMFSFTDRILGHALVVAARRGIDVRLILDESQTHEKNSEAYYLIQNLGSDRVQLRHGRSDPDSIMHHKFAIFDYSCVATGSYNWTTAARNYNYENLILINGPSGKAAATAYEKEFNRIWTAN